MRNASVHLMCSPDRAFDEVAVMVESAASALGVRVSMSSKPSPGPNIVIGHNTYLHRGITLPEQAAVYTFEQHAQGSYWARPEQIAPLKEKLVWSYDPVVQDRLESFGVHSACLPVGYVPEWERIERHDEDIDVAFFGYPFPYRERVVDRLRALGLRVCWETLFGPERDRVYGRAKICLSLGSYEPRICQSIRAGYLLANRRCVISDDFPRPEAYPAFAGMLSLPPEQIAERCAQLCADARERRLIAERGYENFRSWSFTDVLREPLEELLSSPAPRTRRGYSASTMKIAVYAISKNEEQFVARCIDSAKDADVFVLADTGSVDRTVDIARARGAMVYPISVQPWRFDDARNAALSLVPADVDVCVSIDVDEILEPGWRAEVERLWSPGTTQVRFVFDAGRNVRFFKDKIHARSGFRWKHACHEALSYDPRFEGRSVTSELLLMRHLPDDSKSRGQYLDMLRLGTLEDPLEPRHSFYYARELTFWRRWEDAFQEARRYLALPRATWKAERAVAMRLAGKSLAALGRHDEALPWFVQATLEAPERRENWFDLAVFHFEGQRWPECLGAALTAIRTEGHRHDWPTDPLAWGSGPHDLAAAASHALERHDEAVRHAEAALALSPGDERRQLRLEIYQNAAGAPAS